MKNLTHEQWKRIEGLIPPHPKRLDRRGRPPADDRLCLNGILWILSTRAAWRFLPSEYPSKATCHRRFQEWCRDGTFQRIWEALLKDLIELRKLDLSEGFVDGSVVRAKKKATA